MKRKSTWVTSKKGSSTRSRPLFSDMVRAYGQADLIIGRAGAMTISEITAQGKPSLLIPFPFATNNHQEHNALALVKAGAAEMILEKRPKTWPPGRTH